MGYKISVLLWGSLELKCNPASWKWCHRLKLSKRTSVFRECLPFTRFWSSSFPTKCNTLLKKIYFLFIAEGRGRGMSYASIFPVQEISHIFAHVSFWHSLCGFIFWYDELLALYWGLQVGQVNSVKGSHGQGVCKDLARDVWTLGVWLYKYRHSLLHWLLP